MVMGALSRLVSLRSSHHLSRSISTFAVTAEYRRHLRRWKKLIRRVYKNSMRGSRPHVLVCQFSADRNDAGSSTLSSLDISARVDALKAGGKPGQAELSTLITDVAKLRKELVDATSFLPTYDQRQYDQVSPLWIMPTSELIDSSFWEV